jgi:hypothetical protein
MRNSFAKQLEPAASRARAPGSNNLPGRTQTSAQEFTTWTAMMLKRKEDVHKVTGTWRVGELLGGHSQQRWSHRRQSHKVALRELAIRFLLQPEALPL